MADNRETELLPVMKDPTSSTTKIPRIFWYACAYAIFTISTGLAYTALRSTNSSVEAFGVKMELQRALSREKEVLAAVETVLEQPAAGARPPLLLAAPAPAPVPEIKDRLKGWKQDHQIQQQQQQQQQQQRAP